MCFRWEVSQKLRTIARLSMRPNSVYTDLSAIEIITDLVQFRSVLISI